MKVRADFNFSDSAEKIKECIGYVVGEFTPKEYGGDFKPENVYINRFVGSTTDFKKLEELAVKNCKVVYDDKEVEEKNFVEACKICDNNCGCCKYNCNCYTLVEA